MYVCYEIHLSQLTDSVILLLESITVAPSNPQLHFSALLVSQIIHGNSPSCDSPCDQAPHGGEAAEEDRRSGYDSYMVDRPR